MTIADKYRDDGAIMVKEGKVWFCRYGMEEKEIGEIGHVEVIIERLERMLGVYRIENVMIFNERNERLYDDQSIIDNAEYYSDSEIKLALSKRYGITEDIINFY